MELDLMFSIKPTYSFIVRLLLLLLTNYNNVVIYCFNFCQITCLTRQTSVIENHVLFIKKSDIY